MKKQVKESKRVVIVVALIVKDFEKLMNAYSKEMSLGEFVGFAEQLEEAGYIFSVNTTSKGITLLYEKPSFRLILKRLIALITSKRLKLTSWQKYALQEKHYNYKTTKTKLKEFSVYKPTPTKLRDFMNKPSWVKRAINFKVKKAKPNYLKLYPVRPDWVVRAIRFKVNNNFQLRG